MKSIPRSHLLAAAICLFAPHAQAAVTWTQSFPGTGADAPLSTYNWVNYSGATGVLTANGTTSATVPVFSNANGASGTSGYLYDGAGYANRNLWFTDSSPDFAVADLQNVSFSLRSYYLPASGDNTVGFAVRLDGSWYRTEATYMSGADGLWQTFTLSNIAAVNWLKVDFTPGTVLNGLAANGLNPSGAAVLPSTGTIDAIGFYGFQSNPIRFDEIAITVPEPSSALLGLAALPLLGLRRRK